MSYAAVFVDAVSRMRFVFFMHQKSDLPKVFKQLLIELTACNKSPRRLHSDNGGEYRSKKMASICEDWGILQTFTAPHSPAQNGTSERTWRTLMEKARSLLKESHLEDKFWAAAMLTATYITNRLPSVSTGGPTPYKIWTGAIPNLSHMRVFGCSAYVHKEGHQGKLEDRSWKGVFIGYDTM